MKEMGIKLEDKSNEIKSQAILEEIRSSIRVDSDVIDQYKLSTDRFINNELIADPYRDQDSIHLLKLDSMYRNTFKVKSTRVYYSEIIKKLMEQGGNIRDLLTEMVEQEEPAHRSPLYMAKLFINGKYTSKNYLKLFKSTEVTMIMEDL